METDNVTFLPDTIVTALLADPPLSSAADRAGTAAPLQAGAVLDAAAASPAHPPRLSGIRVRNVKSGAEETLPLDGLFVSIGRKPVTALYKDQLALDASGYVIADETTATAIPGVYAVGDLRTKPLRQVITAAADGAVAAHMAEDYPVSYTHLISYSRMYRLQHIRYFLFESAVCPDSQSAHYNQHNHVVAQFLRRLPKPNVLDENVAVAVRTDRHRIEQQYFFDPDDLDLAGVIQNTGEPKKCLRQRFYQIQDVYKRQMTYRWSIPTRYGLIPI